MNASSEPKQGLDSASSGSVGNSVALDQWRGLALVFVLVSHGLYFTERVHGIGRVGVNLFFFISGVLVFRSLAKSRTTTPLALAIGFWKKRMRRLYPALAAYVLLMFPVVFVLRHRPEAWDHDAMTYVRGIPIALLYAVNYWEGKPMSLAHLWSLACEMQFYLLAPLIFLLGGKTTSRRHLVWGLILTALVVWGFVGPLLDSTGKYKYHFEIAVWPMMLGFCCEYRKDLFQRVSSKWLPFIMAVNMTAFGALGLLLLLGFQMKMLVIAVGTFVFIPCFLAYLASWQLSGPVGRALTWLGERTYSIYLLQQPFTICRYLPVILHPAGAVASTLVGALWFRLFERPFLSASRKACVKKRLLSLPVAAAAVVALILCMALLLLARHHYAEVLAAKVWPAGNLVVPPSGRAAPQSNTILLLGDSRVADWKSPKIEGWHVLNQAMGGLTSAELALSCGTILEQTRPQVVIIQIGINDLKLLGVRPECRTAVIDGCVSNILVVVNECRRLGAQVVLTPVWPVGPVSWARRLVWSDAIEPAVAETNLRLTDLLSNKAGIYVVDIFAELTQGLSTSERLQLYRDTLHLKPDVYLSLSEVLSPVIQARFDKSETVKP